MNERIEELAELSGFKQDALNMGIWYSPEFQKFAEQFAELIILESKCWIHKRIGPKTALDFLEHFGVEE